MDESREVLVVVVTTDRGDLLELDVFDTYEEACDQMSRYEAIYPKNFVHLSLRMIPSRLLH